jgi:hypothetical protein
MIPRPVPQNLWAHPSRHSAPPSGKYLYKNPGKERGQNLNSVEDMGELFYRRDQIGIGSLLKVIAIIVREAMSGKSGS